MSHPLLHLKKVDAALSCYWLFIMKYYCYMHIMSCTYYMHTMDYGSLEVGRKDPQVTVPKYLCTAQQEYLQFVVVCCHCWELKVLFLFQSEQCSPIYHCRSRYAGHCGLATSLSGSLLWLYAYVVWQNSLVELVAYFGSMPPKKPGEEG